MFLLISKRFRLNYTRHRLVLSVSIVQVKNSQPLVDLVNAKKGTQNYHLITNANNVKVTVQIVH